MIIRLWQLHDQLGMEATSVVMNVEERHYNHNSVVPVSTDLEQDRIGFVPADGNALTMGERLGVEEFFSAKVWRGSLAELLGTAALVFMTDSISIASYKMDESIGKLINLSINPIVVALIVLATIPITGGHINPIVSMTFGLMGRIPICRAAIYIMAQCTGAILGALALKAVIDGETESTFSLGGCTVLRVASDPDESTIVGLDTARAFYLELTCSFIFLFITRWLAFDARKSDMLSRLIYCFGIGTAVAFNWFLSTTIAGVNGYSGVGGNPATCFGPAVVQGGHLWNNHWIYWVGPTIASMGFYMYTWTVQVELIQSQENKHDFINILKACI